MSYLIKEESPSSIKSSSAFSSPHMKKKTERGTSTGLLGKRPSESQASLNSIFSLSTDDSNWSSFQPNYISLMNDTNLLDNCADAKQEIEFSRQHISTKRVDFFETSKSSYRQTVVDPEQLLKWIAYMKKYLEAFSPTWIEVKTMNSAERNSRLDEMCDLRQYVASHNRVVNEMIREQDDQLTRNIEDKYQMLLLNVIEKQCLLEGFPGMDEKNQLRSSDNANRVDNGDNRAVKLEIYQLCSIDIEPQNISDQLLDDTMTQCTESLETQSDTTTIITSDDGIHFPNHQTSKSSIFSEDHNSPFSSQQNFRHKYSLDSLMKELDCIDINSQSISCVVQKNQKNINDSIRQSTRKLIENVDLVLPETPLPNADELSVVNKKVGNWLQQNPQLMIEAKQSEMPKIIPDACARGKTKKQSVTNGSDGNSSDSTFSIAQQWDNFQEMYTLTVLDSPPASDDFLYFGDDYYDMLDSNCSTASPISEMGKSISTPTSPSKKDEVLPSAVAQSNPRKRKRISRKSTQQKTAIVEQSYQDSETPFQDILLITEDLESNYTNLKPKDFHGIFKLCSENLECLIVVLDKDQECHVFNECTECSCDDKIFIQENCRCGIIGRLIARIVNFLYECPRKIRKTLIYRYLMKMLKGFYELIKFFSERVRGYRSLCGIF